MTFVFVAVGAAVGAPLRYLVDWAVQARHDSLFPWGTFAVNVAGSLILGVLVGAANAMPGELMSLLGTGFCGAFTTYSTFGYETVRLIEERAGVYAAASVIAGLMGGLGAAFAGIEIAGAVWA